MTITIHEKEGRWYFEGHVPATITQTKQHQIHVPDDAKIEICRRQICLTLGADTWDGGPLGLTAAAVWLAAKKGTIHGIYPVATIV